MRIVLLLILLLTTPFVYLDNTGYVKELLFCVITLSLFCPAIVRCKYIQYLDIFLFLGIVGIIANPRFWLQETYLIISLFILCWSVSKYEWGINAIFILLAGCMIYILASFSQTIEWKGQNVNWIISNSGLMGIFIALIFPLAFGYGLYCGNKKIKFFFFFLSSFFLISIILTGSRSAFLAIIISSFYLIERKAKLLFQFKNHFNVKWKNIIIFIILLIGVFVLLYGLALYRIDSAKGRMLIYRVTLDIIMDKPIFGHGYNTFASVYSDYQAAYFKENPTSSLSVFASNTEFCFNEFLCIWAEFGIVGIGFTIILLVKLFTVTASNRLFLVFFKAALLVLVITSMFSYPLRCYETAVVSIIIIGVLSFYVAPIKYKIKKKIVYFFLPLIVVFYSSFLYATYRQVLGLHIWNLAKQEISLNKRLEQYEKVLPYLCNYLPFLYDYAILQSRHYHYSVSNIYLRKILSYQTTYNIYTMIGVNYENMNQIDSAEICYIHANNIAPNRFVPLYKLMMLYENNLHHKEATLIALNIYYKAIKIPSYTVDKIKKEAWEILIE